MEGQVNALALDPKPQPDRQGQKINKRQIEGEIKNLAAKGDVGVFLVLRGTVDPVVLVADGDYLEFFQ